MRIGWIGPGKMGVPMCRHVRDAGHQLTVFGRSKASRRNAEQAGLDTTADLATLVSGCDAVFSTIADDHALRDIVMRPGGLAETLGPAQIFVDMSTVSPDCSTEIAAALEPGGAAYLRAPVSGSTTTAEAGALTVVVSGPQAAFEEVRAVMDTFSKRQFHVGDGEEARYLKLVLNALVGATSALLAEALTLGQKGGLDTATMLEVIGESSVGSPLINYKREMLTSRDYTAQFTAGQMIKDLDLILGSGHSGHVPLPLLSGVRESFEAALAQGHGNDDFFILFELQKRLANI